MRKIYLVALLLCSLLVSVNAQCVVDANNNEVGISPPDSIFPALITGQEVDNSYVAQVYVPTESNLGIQAHVYWIAIFNITGLPSGITYTRNPDKDTIYGGNNACIQLHGTTTDPEGEYPLNFIGAVKVNTQFTGDTVIPLSILNLLATQSGGQGFGYKLRVVDPSTGINDISSALNASMQVMPNPNNGKFEVRFSYLDKIEGNLDVSDITGKVVYREAVNTNGTYSTTVDLSSLAKGMYVVQLKTATGTASKKLTIE